MPEALAGGPLAAPHAAFVLLAEFNIDTGSGLKHQYPQPTGTSELMLADLMLPDGAHDRTEDWTVFFLNQTAALTVQPSAAPTDDLIPSAQGEEERPTSVGAVDETKLLYVISLVRTKKDTTVRRGAVCKAMAVCSRHPFIQIFKPVLLLALEDYFTDPSIDCLARLYRAINSMQTAGMPVFSTAERIILRSSDRKDVFEERFGRSTHEAVNWTAQAPPENMEQALPADDHASMAHRPAAPSAPSPNIGGLLAGSMHPTKKPKDTHWFDTKILYGGMSIPVRIPLQTFPGEIGEYSLIKLIQTFSSPNALSPNTPLHPHLHSNGSTTHPIVLLFNALVSEKRILFLGHGQPAGVVAEFVLAACALGSGCGTVLEGFAGRAFPYSNLTIYEDFQAVPGYIAGVTNPIFELHAEAWDVFCNIETGKITISKDIAFPPSSPVPFSPPALERTLTEASGGGDHAPRVSSGGLEGSFPGGGPRADGARESMDNIFMDEIISAIQAHFGENVVRARFADYAQRFVRLASRHEEATKGFSSIGPPSKPWSADGLGSGIVFTDDSVAKREMATNAQRIEGWLQTESYRRYQKRFADGSLTCLAFDAQHQLARLRQARRMPDAEVEMLFQVLTESVRTDQEIIELLSQTPPHLGGLLPLAFGLLHPSSQVRFGTVTFLKQLDRHPTGRKFCQNLNAFHRLACLRLESEYPTIGGGSAAAQPQRPLGLVES